MLNKPQNINHTTTSEKIVQFQHVFNIFNNTTAPENNLHHWVFEVNSYKEEGQQ